MRQRRMTTHSGETRGSNSTNVTMRHAQDRSHPVRPRNVSQAIPSTTQRSAPSSETQTTRATIRPVASARKPNEQAAKLHPKEHGAYAILAIPIVTALIIAGPNLIGVCIALAAVTGFLAHEPLLVAWGHRGCRAQGNTPAAKTRLLTFLSITSLTGCTAFFAGTASVRWSLVACIVLASTSFALAVAGRHRTLTGQLWGVAGLSLPCVPILIAGGLNTTDALAVWTIWLVGFSASTLAVRSVIAAQKRQSRTQHSLVLATLSLLVALNCFLSEYWLLASLPMMALSWYLLIAPPPAKHLRRVGWTLVAGTVVSALIVVGLF